MIGQNVFSLLVLIMFGYIMLSPLAIGFTVNRAKALHHARPPDAMPPSFARYALEDITANHVLDRTRTYPDSSISLREFADEWVVPHQKDYVVVDDGSVAGIVSLRRLRFTPQGAWSTTPIRNTLRRHPPYALPEDPIDDVLKQMNDHWLTVIPVVDKETRDFLGTVTRHDILDMVTLMDEIAAELKVVNDGRRT